MSKPARAGSSSNSSSRSSRSSRSSDDDDDDDDDDERRASGHRRDVLGDETSDDDDETTRRRTKRGGSSSSLKINKSFAARFEHNERRKEMHRLQAKLEREYATKALGATTSDGDDGDDDGNDDSDSSATDSDEEEELEQAFDATFADALAKIRRRDPSIYDEKTKLFDADDDEQKPTTKTNLDKKKKKKATLREVTATQLLEGGATALEDAEEEAARGVDAGPTYVEEQAALKRAFKDAVEGSDEEDDENEDDGGLVVKTLAEKMVADAAATEKLSEYFNARAEETGGGELSAEDKFLREYLMEKKWLNDDDKTTLKFKKSGGYESSSSSSSSSGDEDDDGGDSESDSELLQRADEFEHKYNFRFEEPGADQIVSHSRHIEGLVRKKDTRRKDKRRETKERKESERAKLLAEVRRLKNLKRDEINSKMKQISSIGGIKDTHGALSTADFTTEFDPEAHDKVMQQMYGDEYYEQGEDDADALEKPEFGDLEEELAMVLKNKGDNPLKGESTDKGFEALRKNVEGKSKEFLASLAGNAIDDDDDDENDDDNNDDDDENDDENKFSKRASKRWRKELMAKMDEYYNLDAEDFIGDLPVRFAYKEVAPKMFGLTTKDVLTMDDKSLNQIVGLKKLAPYRDDANDAAVDANQRARAQRMAREFLAKSKETKKTSKKKKSSLIGDEDEDEDEEEAERAMREKSYADTAFGKKKSSSSSKKRAADADDADRDEALEKKGGKNARKNAKKRAKKKLLLVDEQRKQ